MSNTSIRFLLFWARQRSDEYATMASESGYSIVVVHDSARGLPAVGMADKLPKKE